jgi:hypothetical protein
MATFVTLDIFSGRPNPVRQLTESEESELGDRLASPTANTLQRPSGILGGLGYRGFTITTHDATSGAGANVRIHEAIIDRGTALPNLVDNAGVESFLLDTFGDTLPPDVRGHVQQNFSARQSFELENAIRAGCPACVVADAPTYNPGAWNVPNVQPYNNCYNYANDNPTNTFAQPGRAHGQQATVMDCAQVQPAAVADGLAVSPNFSNALPAGAGWYVALVIWPGADYHWYRQDTVGCWSHKPGQTAVRNMDNAGNAITDPSTCNRGPYTVFCNYMVAKRGLTIK